MQHFDVSAFWQLLRRQSPLIFVSLAQRQSQRRSNSLLPMIVVGFVQDLEGKFLSLSDR